jgi:hypothetical protein
MELVTIKVVLRKDGKAMSKSLERFINATDLTVERDYEVGAKVGCIYFEGVNALELCENELTESVFYSEPKIANLETIEL